MESLKSTLLLMSKDLYPVSGKGGLFQETNSIENSDDDSGYDSIEIDHDENVKEWEETQDDDDEMELVFQDLTMLKFWARIYLHPEDPVMTDYRASSRCYYDRPSADHDMNDEAETEERKQILSDCAMLKKLAVDYYHPEKSVEHVDPTVFGRCYYDRPSADHDMNDEAETEERKQILSDCAMLKKLAVDYYHPEKSVEHVDPTVFGRCYYDRPSADHDMNDEAETEERKQILSDCAMLKKLAVDYYHPEKSVEHVDPTVFGRCYYDRPSADHDMNDEAETEERKQILSDCAMLKKLAVDYYHPEKSVEHVDPTVFGRCYYDRPSMTDSGKIVTESSAKVVMNEVHKASNKSQSTEKFVSTESTNNIVIRSPSAVMLFGLEGNSEAF